ncbi:hypothetical protein QAD02_019222 [Eretmocerus hayati]|uniref:Uncharacterized protein n=1 Tax=Eretmocerus hayati TaxID=131215 RepID=A0ACC2PNR8_9HYME|nr:hypothetical protein QAD02_019222 [Eretmocerus hayati]
MSRREYFKVVLLGDRSTGKTCLMKRYFFNEFNESESMTIGAAFESKVFDVDGKEFQMGVWDTTGEEKYQSICTLYYRGASAAILCHDVSLSSSFHKLNYWMNELRKVVPDCRLYVCATKADLLERYEPSPKLSFARSYAVENGAKYFLTSSKSGLNVDKLFDEVLEDYVAEQQNTPKSTGTIRLPRNIRESQRRAKKCCPS